MARRTESGDGFVNAIQSGSVTFIVGKTRKEISMAKKILNSKSTSLAILAKQNDDVIELPDVERQPIDMFIIWCYQDRLPAVDVEETFEQRKERKDALIDLWIFANHHNTQDLQNRVMDHLIRIFNTPHLLTIRDIRDIWKRTHVSSSPLRHLAAFLMVVQIEEESSPRHGKTIGYFANLQKLDGLMELLYASLKGWLEFEMPKMAKKDRRTKWMVFATQKEVIKTLKVCDDDAAEGTGSGRVEVVDIE